MFRKKTGARPSANDPREVRARDVLTPAIVVLALLGLAGVGYGQYEAQKSAS